MRKHMFVAVIGILVTIMGACGAEDDTVSIGVVQQQIKTLIEGQGPDKTEAEGKCNQWGYNSTINTEYHAACVRMVRAAYCPSPNDLSYTLKGTRVHIYDNSSYPGYEQSEIQPFALEAIWTARGAICLSKFRWDTIPVDGPGCPELVDPRKPGVTYGSVCETKGTWQGSWKDLPLVRIGNDSAYLDKGLYTWFPATGNARYYSTTLKLYNEIPTCLPAGCSYNAAPQFEGAVFQGNTADEVYPDKLDYKGIAEYLVDLCEYEKKDRFGKVLDRWTTTMPSMAGYVCPAGQPRRRIFKPAAMLLRKPPMLPDVQQLLGGGQVKRLYTYYHAALQNHVTVNEDHSLAVKAAGYGDEQFLGWVLYRKPM